MIKNAIGIYRGFVIKNDDPTDQHRVKVWIPVIHGSPTKEIDITKATRPLENVSEDVSIKNMSFSSLEKGATDILDSGIDKIKKIAESARTEIKDNLPTTEDGFRTFIANTPASEINALKERLPWAVVSQSLFGGGGSGYDYGVGHLVEGDGANLNYSTVASMGGGRGILTTDRDFKVDEEHLRSFLINEIRNMEDFKRVPVDGADWKVTGTPESWANFFVALAKRESSLYAKKHGDIGRFKTGSRGLFQLSQHDAKDWGVDKNGYTIKQLENPAVNTRLALIIAGKILRKDGYIYNPAIHPKYGKGRLIGFGRYWGPIAEKSLKVPPVPQYVSLDPSTPSNTPPLPTDGSIETPNTASHPQKTQKPAQAFSSNPNGFSVLKYCRDEVEGENNGVRRLGTPVSLDFNGVSGNKDVGVMIVVPEEWSEDTHPKEWAICMEYCVRCADFMRKYSKDSMTAIVNSNPVRNHGKIKKFVHTEPFNNLNPEGAIAIIKNADEYAKVLAETLGKLPNAVFLPPHEQNGNQGTSVMVGDEEFSETRFAKMFLIDPLLKLAGSGSITTDDFKAVGPTYPEKTRDEQFLKEKGVENEYIESLSKIGEEIYELKEDAKSDQTGQLLPTIKAKKEERDKIWAKIIDSKKDDEEVSSAITQFRSINELDYTKPPLNPKVNPASASYDVNSFSNSAKGMYTIPNVGSPVWVMFEGGNLDSPVVIGLNPDVKHIDSVTDLVDTPQDPSIDTTTRNSHVISARGGSFQIRDTVSNEAVSVTGYHGSSISLNKFGQSVKVVGTDSKLVTGDDFGTIRGDKNSKISGFEYREVNGDIVVNVGDVQSCIPVSTSLKELEKPIHEKKQAFDLARADQSHPQDSSVYDKNLSTPLPCKTCSLPVMTQDNKEGIIIPSFTILGYTVKEIHLKGFAMPKFKKANTASCPDCGGTGFEQSSAGSVAPPNPIKGTIITDIANTTQERSRLENRLGDGGNYLINTTKTFVINAGGVMNDLPSIRVDKKGGKAIVGVEPSVTGETVTKKHAIIPHIEPVAVNSLGGGDIIFNGANKISLMAGSNGISAKTSGQLWLQGRITTLCGDQIIVSSNNVVKIDGGVHLSMNADSVSITSRDKQIGLNGNVGVNGNMAVRGGLHVEGELSLQHITAPVEIKQTEVTESKGFMLPNVLIGVTTDGMMVYSLPSNKPAVTSSHSHAYSTIASSLMPDNNGVREHGSGVGNSSLILAKQVNDDYDPSKNSSTGKPSFASVSVDSPLNERRGNSTPDSFMPKFNRWFSSMRFLDPNLFAFYDDCRENNKTFLKQIDAYMLGEITEEELTESLTNASESEHSETNRISGGMNNGCDNPCL